VKTRFLGSCVVSTVKCKMLPNFRRIVALMKMKNKGKIRNNIDKNYVKMK
jgi:hypothetical protein